MHQTGMYRMSQAVALKSDCGKLLKASGMLGAWRFEGMDPGTGCSETNLEREAKGEKA